MTALVIRILLAFWVAFAAGLGGVSIITQIVPGSARWAWLLIHCLICVGAGTQLIVFAGEELKRC